MSPMLQTGQMVRSKMILQSPQIKTEEYNFNAHAKFDLNRLHIVKFINAWHFHNYAVF